MSIEVRVLITSGQVLSNQSYSIPCSAPVGLRDLLSDVPLSADEQREIWAEQSGEFHLRSGLAVLINGLNVMHSGGLDTEVRDGDRVSLIHGISGG